MNKFFVIHSWVALLACVLILWQVVPMAHSIAPLIGAIASAMALCGKPAYDYMHDPFHDRDTHFRELMMSSRTNFPLELLVQLSLTASLSFMAYILSWRVLWFFAGGGMVSIACFIVRYIYKVFRLPR